MKPVITVSDYTIIRSLITNLPPNQRTKEIGQLAKEIESATKVADEQIEADIIRLNSYFEVEETQSKQILKLTLTLPKQADLAEKKISIFTPMGVALIGFKAGMQIEWVLPGGPKKLKILKVENEQVLNSLSLK
jgi:regulator of nucleoside diphosphate kinase